MRYLLIFLLAGCSTGFSNPSARAGDWERDLYACRKEAAPAAAQQITYTRMMDECLALRGWRER